MKFSACILILATTALPAVFAGATTPDQPKEEPSAAESVVTPLAQTYSISYDQDIVASGSGLTLRRRRPFCSPSSAYDTIPGSCTASNSKFFNMGCRKKSTGAVTNLVVSCLASGIFGGFDSNGVQCSMLYDSNRAWCTYMRDDDADNDNGQSCSWDNRKDGEPASPGKWSNTRSGITNVKCGKRKL